MYERVKANFYAKEDIKWFPKEHTHRYTKLDNDCLYAFHKNGVYNTKLTPKDLPTWYVYGRYYKRWGYINTKGIKDIVYKPMKLNHSLRDDCIMISYDKPITYVIDRYGYKDYECDERIWGNEIIDVLVYAEKYSKYVIDDIIEQMWQKMEWLKENELDCYEREVKDREHFNKWFERARERRDCND